MENNLNEIKNKNTSIINNNCQKELENVKSKIIKFNEPMYKHTSFKVGGNADAYISVDNIESLKNIINISKKYSLPITIIGNGTNLLVKDNGIRGIVINYSASEFKIIEDSKQKKENIVKKDIENLKISQNENTKYLRNIEINKEKTNENKITIKVSAGMKNGALAQILLKNELTGFEFASGIPGTIGGAIYMNAGAFGSEISNIVESVTYLNLNDLKIYKINNDDCKFAYRTSIFEIEENTSHIYTENELKTNNNNNNKIILEAILKFEKGKKENILQKMNEYNKKRIESQPLDKPSAGSTFKRGENFITAKLIDECNLKGYTIGGAQVSEKHAGFIINNGNATAQDIIELIQYVKEKAYQKFGVKIETEVRIIGE